MKWHWWKLAALAVLLCCGVIAFQHVWHIRSQRERETTYQQALRSYSANLKPGATRKDVEAYIHSRGAAFERSRGDASREAVDDLILIGKDEDTWYCSDNNVYLQFGFESSERTSDDDDLMKIVILHRPGKCL